MRGFIDFSTEVNGHFPIKDSEHNNAIYGDKFDMAFLKTSRKYVEVIESATGLELCYYDEKRPKDIFASRLREMSGFTLNFPYVACCKGNSELIIRNFHYVNE